MRAWLRSKSGGVFRFVAILGVGMIVFNIVFFVWVSPGEAFQSFLALNANWSSKVLSCLGEEVDVVGRTLVSPQFSLDIKRGCDGIQVEAFLFLAIMSWPLQVTRWRRFWGLLVGPTVLAGLNLLRVASLYYAGVHYPNAFQTLHMDVWQPVFIVVALVLWATWIRWAANSGNVVHSVGH